MFEFLRSVQDGRDDQFIQAVVDILASSSNEVTLPQHLRTLSAAELHYPERTSPGKKAFIEVAILLQKRFQSAELAVAQRAEAVDKEEALQARMEKAIVKIVGKEEKPVCLCGFMSLCCLCGFLFVACRCVWICGRRWLI